MQKLTDLDLGSMEYYTFKEGTVAGIENVLIATTGYTGAGGMEVYVKMRMPKSCGMLFLQQEQNLVSCQ
jgi:aminomethyltransferase